MADKLVVKFGPARPSEKLMKRAIVWSGTNMHGLFLAHYYLNVKSFEDSVIWRELLLEELRAAADRRYGQG
jgi:hypothetical protein